MAVICVAADRLINYDKLNLHRPLSQSDQDPKNVKMQQKMCCWEVDSVEVLKSKKHECIPALNNITKLVFVLFIKMVIQLKCEALLKAKIAFYLTFDAKITVH